MSQRLKAAVAEHDPELAEDAPTGSASLTQMADWLELHFPTGDWRMVRNLMRADEIVRAYPRKKAGK